MGKNGGREFLKTQGYKAVVRDGAGPGRGAWFSSLKVIKAGLGSNAVCLFLISTHSCSVLCLEFARESNSCLCFYRFSSPQLNPHSAYLLLKGYSFVEIVILLLAVVR